MPQAYNRRQPMSDIKRAAAERARKMGLSYAGALLPAEAYELMKGGAKLVDVRTKPELLYVGSIPGAVTIEWQTYPGSRPKPEFLGEVQYTGKFPDKVNVLDPTLPARLRAAFAGHPRVAAVGAIRVLSPRQVQVELTFRS